MKNGNRYNDSLTPLRLDALWDFCVDRDDVGLGQKWYINFPAACDRMPLPACWNNTSAYFDYTGTAWYQTYFTAYSPNLYICFEGVLNTCDVFLDGNLIGSHDGGFTDFEFFAEGLSDGNHKLTVRVNNNHNSLDSIPLTRVDWFHYGGIFKEVKVYEYSDFVLIGKKIDYELSPDLSSAEINAEFRFKTYNDAKVKQRLIFSFDGKEYFNNEIDFSTGDSCHIGNFTVGDIKLWDIFRPNLYNVKIQIGDKIFYERIGFRKVETLHGEFFLNDKKIFLKGVNRHEEHPDWGFSVPFCISKKDVDNILMLGCNIIRGSHYPVSAETLDYCDEKGILFWEEIPMWGYPEDAIKNVRVNEVSRNMLRAMVKRDFHHPCIIIWGCHNEIDTRTQAAYKLTEQMTRELKAYDNKRLLTYASKYCYEDICFELVDFVAINLYYGWYDDLFDYWHKCIDDLNERLEKLGLTDMPVIVSEFGVEALYGYNTMENQKWSENYQSHYLESVINILYSNKSVQGLLIWQYADIRSSDSLAIQRPRGFNNKGLVNEYRLPKEAFYTVKQCFEKLNNYIRK